MEVPELNIVTGGFGYTGKYITRRLLWLGKRVKTLTGHPSRPNPFGDQVSVAPFNFDNLRELTKSLSGATTLYNTYWVRFPYRQVSFEKAVENTKTLIKAAEAAGLRRIVHLSITNASANSPLAYFRGKGVVEEAICGSKLSYAIVRPAVIFGPEDILVNNIAWLLRRFPVFAIFGAGEYKLQPVFVEDVAEIAVGLADRHENIVIDAAGPEVYTFEELVRLIAATVGSKAKIIHLTPPLAFLLCKLTGYVVKDVVLTRAEVTGLMSNLLVSQAAPTAQTRLSDWLRHNADRVGTSYASELARHYR